MMSSIENEDNREGFGCLGTEENVNGLVREKETREIQYNCNSVTCTLEFLALNLHKNSGTVVYLFPVMLSCLVQMGRSQRVLFNRGYCLTK